MLAFCFDEVSAGPVSRQRSLGKACDYAVISKSLNADSVDASMPSGSMSFSNGEAVFVLIVTVTSRDKCRHF